MSWLFHLFEWLAHACLVSLPLFVAGSLAVVVCRQPVRRIRLIELTLAGCLVAPWFGFIPGWPQWSVSWPASSVAGDSPDEPAVEAIARSEFTPARLHDDWLAHGADARLEAGAAENSDGLAMSPPAFEPVAEGPVSDTARGPSNVRPEWFDVRPWIAAAGLLGFGGLGVWWLVGIVGLARLIRTARPVPEACGAALRDIAGPAGERVVLLHSDRIAQPFACLGLRCRSLIVLPTSLCAGESRDEQALRWCLAHEWSHVERGDLWAWLLAGVARVLYFYQPLAWWLRRQLRLSQDYIADARAASQAGESEDYAAFLTRQALTGSRVLAAAGLGIGGGKSDLYRRVVMLVRNSGPLESRCGWLWNISAIAAMLTVLIAVSSFRTPLGAVETIDQPGDVQAREQDENGTALRPRAIRELGERRLRQRSSVRSVAFSPDGRWIASCGFNSDTGIRLWDVATGRLVRTLRAPDRQWYNANVVAFSPDGAEVIAGHADGKVSVWDPDTGQRLTLVALHDARITAIAVSSDGKTLCTGGADGQVISSLLTDPGREVWKQRVGEREPRGVGAIDGTYGVADVALTPDGRHVVAGISKSGSILVLRADTGEVVREIREAHGEESSTPGDSLTSIAVSPDGAHIISGGNRMMRREDVPPEIVAYLGHIQISQVRVWSLATGERVSDLLQGRYEQGWGHTGLSPDGQTIAMGKRDELQLIASGTGEVLWSTRVDGWWDRQPVFSPDGNLIAAPVSNAVGLWDSRTGQRVHADRPGHGGEIRAADYCSTGRLIATAGGSDVQVWDAESGEHRFHKTLGPGSHIWDVEFAQGGEHLAVCGQTNDAQGRWIGIVVLWSPQGEEVAVAHLPKRGEGLALSPDGNRFVAAYSSGGVGDTRLELWSLRRAAGGFRAFRGAQRVAEFPREPGSGLSKYATMHFSADGRYVLIAEYDGTVTRWDTSAAAEDSNFVADWRTQKRGARERVPWMGEAVFTADGTRLVAATRETINVWNVATGELERAITVPIENPRFRLAIAADSRTLAAANVHPGPDTIRLFDITTGAERLRLEPDDDQAQSLAFAPDGKRLVTGLSRGTALVWDLREEAKVSQEPTTATTEDEGVAQHAADPRNARTAVPLQARHNDVQPEQQDVPREIHRTRLTTVRASDNNPLPDLRIDVEFWRDGRQHRESFVTSRSGVAQLELPTGESLLWVRIRARPQGLVPIAVAWGAGRFSEPFSPPAELTLRFESGVTIGGIVKDELGTPVEGASVEIHGTTREAGSEIKLTTTHQTVSDENGRWSWETAPAELEDLTLNVTHPDYANKPVFRPLSSISGLDAFRRRAAVSTLIAGFQVSGRVMDAHGKPVANARAAVGEKRFGSYVRSTKTDNDGRFAIRYSADGLSIVTIEAADYSPELRQVVISTDMEPLDFALKQPAVIRGRVVDPEGKPVSGAFAAADTWRGHRSLSWRVDTDDQGRFEWKSAPHDVVLFDFGGHHYFSNRGVRLIPQDEEHVITLRPAQPGEDQERASKQPADAEAVPADPP